MVKIASFKSKPFARYLHRKMTLFCIPVVFRDYLLIELRYLNFDFRFEISMKKYIRMYT